MYLDDLIRVESALWDQTVALWTSQVVNNQREKGCTRIYKLRPAELICPDPVERWMIWEVDDLTGVRVPVEKS